MSLQYKFFKISLHNLQETENEINRFLRSVKVAHVQREFVADNENSFWTIAVEYMSMTSDKSTKENQGGKKNTVDYRQILSSKDFALFARLREWRKEKAAEENIPVYAVFTNEQLAKITEERVENQTALQKIAGIGEGKSAKYGEAVFKIIAAETSETQAPERGHETSGPTVPSHTDV